MELMNHLKYICIFSLLFARFVVGYSQIISGYVVDCDTKRGIENCFVYIVETGDNTATDSCGYFSLKTDSRNVKLSFYHVSYAKKNMQVGSFSGDTDVVADLVKRKVQLDEAEIVASIPRIKTTESYSHISIDNSVIAGKIATSLIDVLEEVPGITKRAEYFSPIVLRGLGGKRILITKDGNRRMGNFSKGFMGQGINIYDLEKIEVIKGPASVIYGPGAIAGIINMKTKYPFQTPGVSGRIMTSYGANNRERMVFGGVNWASLDHAFSFSGRYRKADEYTYGDNITAGNSDYEDKDIRLSYSYEGNCALRLTAESELHLGGPWGRAIFSNGSYNMTMRNKTDDTWHSAVTAVWKREKRLKLLEASVYYDWEQREHVKDSYDIGTGRLSYREEVSYKNHYCGWRELNIIGLTPEIELKTGSDGVFYRIESPTELTDYFIPANINNRVTKNAGVFIAGVFAESEYTTPDEKIKLRGGLRFDYSNINEGDVHDTTYVKGRKGNVYAWNGTSSIVYQVKKDINVSFQVARSCRMPDAKEMFICTTNSEGWVWGNSDLIPEHGLNIDAGLRGKIKNVSFDCSLFSNFLNDFIALKYWRNSGKKGINYIYRNIDRARIMGAELAVHMKWDEFLSPDNSIDYNSTFVYTLGDDLDSLGWFDSGEPLRNIPPFNTTHNITFRRIVNSSVSWYLGGNILLYTDQNRYAPTSEGGYFSPGYCLFGASAGVTYRKHSIKWMLRIKGDNLANNKYKAFEALTYSMGRNFKAMLTVEF